MSRSLQDGVPSLPDKLRTTTVAVVDSEACAAAYRRQGYTNVDATAFCAGATDGDSCQVGRTERPWLAT